MAFWEEHSKEYNPKALRHHQYTWQVQRAARKPAQQEKIKQVGGVMGDEIEETEQDGRRSRTMESLPRPWESCPFYANWEGFEQRSDMTQLVL